MVNFGSWPPNELARVRAFHEQEIQNGKRFGRLDELSVVREIVGHILREILPLMNADSSR